MKILEIKNVFKELFEAEKGLVKTVDSVYEKSDDGNSLKLVISIHDLRVQDTLIIHTKFIFKSDLNKDSVTENSFIYLYDINCVYHTVNFSDANNLKEKIKKIVNSNKFGKDIQTLSEFIDTPAVLLSHYFNKNNITNYSIGNVQYDPKFKIKPCNETTFDFVINVMSGDNSYDINLCIAKRKTEEVKDGKKEIQYNFIFKIMDKTETVEVDELTNIHFLIGGKIVEILNKILK